MQLLVQAEAALLRNWRIVLVYLILSIITMTCCRAIFEQLKLIVPEETTPKPFWFVLANLGLDLTLVGAIAALQSVAFAAIGADMDRPQWKWGEWQESLKRFFSVWFILNLLFITSNGIPSAVPASIQIEVLAIVFLFQVGMIVLGVPFCTCIVYGGGLVWREVPAMLLPFFRLFHLALIAVALGFLQCVVIGFTARAGRDSLTLWALTNVPLILVECLAFAVMWLVCMNHRDIADQYEEDDFDM